MEGDIAVSKTKKPEIDKTTKKMSKEVSAY